MDTLTTTCSYEDCDVDVFAKGLCKRHYSREYKRRTYQPVKEAQAVTNNRSDRCEAICPVRSDGGEVFYVRCDRDGTEEKPHGGSHKATLRVDRGNGWAVSWPMAE